MRRALSGEVDGKLCIAVHTHIRSVYTINECKAQSGCVRERRGRERNNPDDYFS